MFDLGFIADIRFLLRRMPPPRERSSMLFSATLSHRVMELAYEHMDNPEPIKTVTTGVTADGVRQVLYQPATDEKVPLLLGLLETLQPPRSIVFVNTKRAAEKIEGYLAGNDIACGTLSGDVRQSKRQRILADFTAGKLPVLIATDVAARGLHIDDVSHVFNYDLPQQAEDYVHRIGRTARAGTQGVAVSFACENYSFSLPEIQEFIGQSIPLEMITDELLVKPKPPVRVERDRVGGKPSGKGGRGRSSRSDSRPGQRSGERSGSRSGSRSAPPRTSRSETASGPDRAKSGNPDQAASGPTADAGAAALDKKGAPSDKPKRRRRRPRKKPATAAASAPVIDTPSTGNQAAVAQAAGVQQPRPAVKSTATVNSPDVGKSD